MTVFSPNSSIPNKEVEYVAAIIDVPTYMTEDMTVVELTFTESLLSPTIMSTYTVNDPIHSQPIKILDLYKGKEITSFVERKLLRVYGLLSTFQTSQKIYRVSDRKRIHDGREKYTIHACDDSLFTNIKKRVSKSWYNSTPSEVVKDILTLCLGIKNMDIESTASARTYIAENIHPFQVITENADEALAEGIDPSVLHYMTFDNLGTHFFRSLKTLTKQPVVATFSYSEKGTQDSFANPYNILDYEFPCDFDLVSDLMNGIDQNGSSLSSLVTYNPFSFVRTLLGNPDQSCGMGSSVMDEVFTNFGTGSGTANTNVEKYKLLRQARLSLLDQDKIALRITVPWNPVLHAGRMIKCIFYNKNPGGGLEEDYGTGEYLISTLTHTIRGGGFGTTTMDLLAGTVGFGEV